MQNISKLIPINVNLINHFLVRNLYLRIAKEKNWIIINEMKNNKQMGINEIHNIIYNKLKLK